MDASKPHRHLKIGLQTKSALVLAVVVLAATAAGGWLYYLATADILRQNDRQQADRLAGGLALAAADGLDGRSRETLQRLVTEMLGYPNVHYVSISDRAGKLMAIAERVAPGVPQFQPASRPASLSYETPLGAAFLEIGRPVVVFDAEEGRDVLAGNIRLIMDTRPTAKVIAGVEQQIAFIVAVIVLCAIPVGYLLVWRVLVVPIRRLVSATRRLAEGDFAARAGTDGNDEIGELGASFDSMADRLHAFQQDLRLANESLEQKVAQRTAELERTNRRLREEMAEKEDFLRAVSHDLNAPLRNIAGMSTMILMKWRGQLPEEVLARLRRIQANVEAETSLLGDLLELSRIRTRPQKRQWVDVGALLQDLHGAFEFELKQKSISLTLAAPMPTLFVERNRLREVFQNLIDNAIKYMHPRADGRIEIAYRQVEGMHRFSVADNGPGIAPEEQQRVFHVFRRAASAATANVPGKGIGLAVVRSVVANYEGRAWVESQPPNGSTFHVELSARSAHGPDEKGGSENLQPESRPAVGDSVGPRTGRYLPRQGSQ